jgi:hypothetical protein
VIRGKITAFIKKQISGEKEEYGEGIIDIEIVVGGICLGIVYLCMINNDSDHTKTSQ